MAEAVLHAADLQTLSDFQHVEERIQGILASDGDPPQETMEEVAGLFASAVTLVNRRLKECDELLQRGHRTECLAKCDTEPKLLDLVSLLSFAEVPHWVDYVRQFNIAAPPELRIDIAQRLNAAFSAAKPLEALMMQHRQFALSAAPLRARIEVMRKIAKLDAANPIWEPDLKTYEEARHRQLKDEYEALVAENNLPGLHELEKELAAKDWLVPPKPALMKEVAQTTARMRMIEARQCLQELTPRLVQAYNGFALEPARALRADWLKLNEVARLKDGDALFEQSRPALDWLSQQDQLEQEAAAHQAAVAALTQALDKRRSRETLVKLYHDVQRFDRGVPEALEAQYQDRLKQLAAKAATQARTRLITTVVAIVAFAGLSLYGVIFVRGFREKQAHVANLKAHLQAGRLPEAGRYFVDLQKNSPGMYQSADVQKLHGEWKTAVEQDTSRAQKLDDLLATAARLGLGEARWDDFPPALEALKEAGDLTVSADEEKRVTDRAREVAANKTRIQTAADETISRDMEDVKQRMGLLRPDDVTGATDLRKAAEGLRARKEPSAKAKQQLETLVGDLAKLIQSAELLVEETRRLDEIAAAVDDRTQYRTRLESYAADRQFAGTPRATDFAKVLAEEAPLWQGLEQWNVFLDHWSSRGVTELNDKDATLWLTNAGTLLAEQKDFPWAPRVGQITDQLKAVAVRKSALPAVEALLRGPLVSGMFSIAAEDKNKRVRRYYSRELPESTGTHYRVKALKSTVLNEAPRTTMVGGDGQTVLLTRTGNGEPDFTSPQTKFGRRAQDAFDKLNGGNWESTFLDLLSQLHADPDMDAVLKLQLMERIIVFAGQGSSVLGELLAPHLARIRAAQLPPDSKWIDPDDLEGQNSREVANSVLRKMDDPGKLKPAVEKFVDELRRLSFEPRFQWAGWLHKNRDGQWVCSSRNRPGATDAGELYLLVRSSDPPVKFEKVGQISGGEFSLNEQSRPNFVEGRPVYRKR